MMPPAPVQARWIPFTVVELVRPHGVVTYLNTDDLRAAWKVLPDELRRYVRGVETEGN